LVVGGATMNKLEQELDGSDTGYGATALMGTFLGNHDVPRTISIAADTEKFSGSPWRTPGKDIAWDNPKLTVPSTREPFERFALAYTVIMTTYGVPLVYYGDECAMAGAGDPDNRRMMECFGSVNEHQAWFRNRLEKLIAIRHAQPALRRGTRSRVGIADDVYTYKMSGGGGDDVYVALNRAASAQPITGLPTGDYRDLLNDEDVSGSVSVPARSARILVAR
jgi:glycosidase